MNLDRCLVQGSVLHQEMETKSGRVRGMHAAAAVRDGRSGERFAY